MSDPVCNMDCLQCVHDDCIREDYTAEDRALADLIDEYASPLTAAEKAQKESKRRYIEAHREEINARQRARYAATREAWRARGNAWYAAHRDEQREHKRAFYAAHKDEINAKRRRAKTA